MVGKNGNSIESKLAENQLDSAEKRVLEPLSMLKLGQLEETEPILKITTKPQVYELTRTDYLREIA